MALDIGDRWTGVALSDPLGILARPHITQKTTDLIDFLRTTLTKENISCIVIGLPTTLRGTQSEQTKKIIATHNTLQQLFPHLEWKLWDERLTSKQANSMKKAHTKEDKLRSHSLAAAIILSTYLEFKRFNEPTVE